MNETATIYVHKCIQHPLPPPLTRRPQLSSLGSVKLVLSKMNAFEEEPRKR